MKNGLSLVVTRLAALTATSLTVSSLAVSSLVLASLTVVLSADSAEAIPFHRCNGRIQYRPCTVEVSKSMPRPMRSSSPNEYARVVSSEFSELPRREGVWRGSVAGNGRVHLRLLIRKNGIIQSSRYMGNVDLADRSTTFAFRSVTPPGKDWSWDIEAYNG